MRILIVEDEAIIAEDMRQILLSLGHTSCWVISTEAAENSVQNGWPEVILMDANLREEGDGIRAANRILQAVRIPLVFLTSSAIREITSVIPHVRWAYCSKPIHRSKLARAIKQALSAALLPAPLAPSHSISEAVQ
jgi:CheY-like chemotaxis protein